MAKRTQTTAKREKREKRDLSTEEKIKKAALKLFTRKGYAATRTRDISQEAGINLALLNYYFRSKEKLFELVMIETLQKFFRDIAIILNDESTSVEEKIERFVVGYTDLLRQQPDLPMFILHEIRQHPQKLAAKMGAQEVFDSLFFRQVSSALAKRRMPRIHPVHFLINMVAMCVFPFIAAPLLRQLAGMNKPQFDKLVEDRKRLVPQWMERIMNQGDHKIK